MYALKKKISEWLKTELKRKMPFFTGWTVKKASQKGEPVPDLIVSAKFSGKPYSFCIEIKRAGYPQHIRNAIASLEDFRKSHPYCYPIVAVPLISKQGKDICDAHNTGYLDTAGNIKIVSGSIFIEKESVKDALPGFVKNETQSQSMFSPKASRIAKYLLVKPQKKLTQKEIVDNTGLSKGMVSRIVGRMINAGYLSEAKGTFSVSSFNDLLSAWAAADLKTREASKRFYVWAQNPRQLMRSIVEKLGRHTVKYAFTGEAGASLRAPFSTFEIVSLYIESFDKFPVSQLSAQETGKGFNVVLFEPRDEAILTQAVTRNGMKVADDLQLYIDLIKNPLRGQKQAEHLLSIIKKGRT